MSNFAEAFDAVVAGMRLTPDQRRIFELENKLHEALGSASEARVDLAELRAVFARGWRADENQWRLPKEVILAMGVKLPATADKEGEQG